jgi:pilus assembly protein CpaC
MRQALRISLASLLLACTPALLAGQSTDTAKAPSSAVSAPAAAPSSPRHLVVNVGKSIVLESPTDIKRVSVVSDDVLEVTAVSTKELVINGRGKGETSLIIWQAGGERLMFDVSVQEPAVRDEKRLAQLEGLRRELKQELGDQEIYVSLDQEAVFLRGTVKDVVSAERAVEIASVFGKPVNLLRISTPAGPTQILLKVKFADVDRSLATDKGFNLFSTGAANTIGAISTGQYSAPSVTTNNGQTQFTLSDALNVFLFRPDLNLGATIKLLESQGILQILSEPNLLTSDGTKASFLSGGEFPFPVVQAGSSGAPVVTIQFREFGIRLNFTPRMTPRGTIELNVSPEVSSLDFSHGLLYDGFNIPALTTRKINTQVELRDGQSFAIAGLLDNEVTDNLSKMPGLSSIPLLGKLFQSHSVSRTKTELLVVVTPEIVHPVPAGQALPEVKMPRPFMAEGTSKPPSTPGVGVTGTESSKPLVDSVPVEQLLREQKGAQSASSAYQTAATPSTVPSAAIPQKTEDKPVQ